MQKKKKKTKLSIKKIFIFMILIILILVILLNSNKKSKLEKLGYSKSEINIINNLSNEEKNTIYKYSYNKNLIDVIKNKDYKSDKLEEYIKLLDKYDDAELVIKYVNNYSKLELDDISIKFIDQKYFISDFLDRYKKYLNNNKNLDYEEIVRRVNSNLDYTFYEDSTKADLSKGMLTLVNKYYYLDKSYVPDDLDSVSGIYARDSAKLKKVAKENFIKMADDARKEGLTLKVTTGYRSYNFQSTLYNNYVKRDGIKDADTYSARPGYSEHQLGYSADITNKDLVSFREFENTKEYEWLLKNAYKYGFIMRYPKNKEYITGYMFESWHFRYVGLDIAKYIYENDITYEEYYAYFIR